jgi:hypothetical protein
MKVVIIVAAICTALFLVGCASESLLTDEEYYQRKGPAPNSPDFSQTVNPRRNY